jgi:hypothetical protein
MDFRWVAAMTLWTVFSGPVFIDLAVGFRAMTMNQPNTGIHTPGCSQGLSAGEQRTMSIQAYLAMQDKH